MALAYSVQNWATRGGGGGGGEGGTYFASLAKGLGVFAQLKLGDSIKYRARCKFLFKEAK